MLLNFFRLHGIHDNMCSLFERKLCYLALNFKRSWERSKHILCNAVLEIVCNAVIEEKGHCGVELYNKTVAMFFCFERY